MRSAHSMARRCPHEGQRPLARHENGTVRSSFLLAAIRIHAAQPHEPVVRVPALEEPGEERLDSCREGAVLIAESLVPNLEELFHGVLDDLLELVRGRAWAVTRLGGRGRRHEGAGPKGDRDRPEAPRPEGRQEGRG